MINKTLMLSICIPTYNRSAKVLELAKSIINANLNIEVVVIDNCSSDEHVEQLKELNNPYYKLILRKKNIGGNANVADAMSYSSGIFSLLCLDKDYINIEYLSEIIEFLSNNSKIVWGQCVLNANQTIANVWFEQGFVTLQAKGYDCHHPTGFFVNNEELKKTGVVDKILSDDLNFPFNIDLIKAHLIISGRGCYINYPLMYTETGEQAAKERSHTYSGENIWFFPKNIIIRAQLFIADAITLKLSPNELKQLINKIYSMNQSSVSGGFNSLMQNESICAHHGISTCKVRFFQTWYNLMNFKRSFLKFDMPISKAAKYKIVYSNLLKILARKLLTR